jgi:hypothetical protein
MFNAVSRKRLREIISAKFPTLEAFADVIYEGSGQTFVRLENGEWEIISVTEGFTQGCPISPVFAAIVLNDILSTIQKELNLRAEQRRINGEPGDDNLGTLGITLAYVDDCNVLLHHEDVLFFLDCFKQLVEPLGAVLNTEKTRILTTTTGSSSGLGQKGSHPFHVPNCSRIFYFKCLELIPIFRFITLKVNLGDTAKKTKTNYPNNRLQITPDHLAKPLPLNNKLSKYLLWWHPLYR